MKEVVSGFNRKSTADTSIATMVAWGSASGFNPENGRLHFVKRGLNYGGWLSKPLGIINFLGLFVSFFLYLEVFRLTCVFF